MHAAFDKALYHQSQGFLTDDPVLMYKDLRDYFYGRDNNDIKFARLHLEKYRFNPANSLNADINLFEEAITNLEYASGEIITENIRLSYVDEKFGQDVRLGVRERLTHCQCSNFTYMDTMNALKDTPNASVTPNNTSRMNTLLPVKSKEGVTEALVYSYGVFSTPFSLLVRHSTSGPRSQTRSLFSVHSLLT